MKSSIDSKENFYSVLGISMGDEGKGRVVHEILEQTQKETKEPPFGVIKVNGGANAGHTAAGLKLNLLPSGVGNPDVSKLIIGSGVVADPRKFLWEAMPLESRGISVLNRLQIDQKTQVSDITHRLLDLAWENYREKILGMEKRGSTGRGISPAYCDETGHWQVFYQTFLEKKDNFHQKLLNRVNRAIDTIKYVCKVNDEDWEEFFVTLSDAERKANSSSISDNIFKDNEFDFNLFKGDKPFSINLDYLVETYWEAGQRLSHTICDIRKEIISKSQDKKIIVAEFGQAYWLDKRHGFTPNVTASHTTSSELFASISIPIRQITTIGCCKAYDTKVGTHHFITKIDHSTHPIGKKLAKLEYGTSTGRQRMVGWFDAVEKGNTLRYNGFDEIVINKLDALTLDNSISNSDLKICIAYQAKDGRTIHDVPRSETEHKSLTPIYETLKGWDEDLSLINSFDMLPKNAKLYISKMMSSIIKCAYPENYENYILPNIRFIGVGPDPGQIISDIPKTIELINYK